MPKNRDHNDWRTELQVHRGRTYCKLSQGRIFMMGKSLKCKINFQSVKVPMRGHLNEDWSLLGSKIISKSGSLDNSKLLHVVLFQLFYFSLYQPVVKAALIKGEQSPLLVPLGKRQL